LALRPRDANEDRAFLREVEEGARNDAMADAVRRYGLAIGLGVLALLLLVGGLLWWRHEQMVTREELAERYVTTLDDLADSKGGDVAAKMAPLIASSNEGYRAVARLLLGDEAVKAGDLKTAAARYGEVAADAGVGEPLRRVALVRQTTVQFEGLPPAEIQRRLAPLLTPGNPWFGSAGELVAHAHIRAGRTKEAADLLARIAADSTVPDSLRSRATQLAGSMGVDAVTETVGEPNTGSTP